MTTHFFARCGHEIQAHQGPTKPSCPDCDATDQQVLLTPREVASIFRVSTRTPARWSREGKLDAIRTPGGQRRFREADVRALLVLEGGVS